MYNKRVGNSAEDIRIVVESVHPLTDPQQTKLHTHLKKLFNPRKVECFFKLNPDLLGGIRLDFDSVIVDDSVKTKLDQFVMKVQETTPSVLSAHSMMSHIEKELSAFNPLGMYKVSRMVSCVSQGCRI